MKKIEDIQKFVVDLIKKEYNAEDGCAMVYELGKEHLLIEYFDKEDRKAGEIIVNLKKEKIYKNGHGYKIKIEGTPKGMIRYYLEEEGRKLEGKAEGLFPCLPIS